MSTLNQYTVTEYYMHPGFKTKISVPLKVHYYDLNDAIDFASSNRRNEATTIEIFSNNKLVAKQDKIGCKWV
jgi:hypothetical protein